MISKIYIQKEKGIQWYKFTCPYCKAEHKIPYMLLKLRFLIKGECKFHHHCSQCHKTTTKQLMFNIVNDHTDKDERIMNGKKLWDDRIR